MSAKEEQDYELGFPPPTCTDELDAIIATYLKPKQQLIVVGDMILKGTVTSVAGTAVATTATCFFSNVVNR